MANSKSCLWTLEASWLELNSWSSSCAPKPEITAGFALLFSYKVTNSLPNCFSHIQTTFCVQFLLQEEVYGKHLCFLSPIQTCEYLTMCFESSVEEISDHSFLFDYSNCQTLSYFPGSFLMIGLIFSLLLSGMFSRKGKSGFGLL